MGRTTSEQRAASVRVMQAVLRGYQLSFSLVLGRQCRFLPTCSQYAHEAIGTHGVVRGSRLALGRVCRCGPRLPVFQAWQERVLGPSHGWDPVPERSGKQP